MRCLYDSTGSLQVIEIKSQRFSRLDDVIDNLQKLRSYNRTIVSYSTLASLKHQVTKSTICITGTASMRQPIIHEVAYICTYVYDIHIVGVISKYVVRKRNLFLSIS